MALLEVKDLSVHFHSRHGVVEAINDVSFSVDLGETLAIVGESGSGKSVTCYSILDLLPKPPAVIESGTALFDGEDLLTCSADRMRHYRGHDIAMIFQDPMTSLNPFLTIGEQLIEPLIYHPDRSLRQSRNNARSQAVALLNEVGIVNAEQRFDSYPHEFSGGMRQRVMIAMALINKPRLLICDEPTTALDVTIQAQILKLIVDLQKSRDLAVIFISHDLGVVSDIADNVMVICDGTVQEQNKTENIFHHSQSDYTQKLLAAIPQGAKQAQNHRQPNSPLVVINHLKTYFRDFSQGSQGRGSRGETLIKAVEDVSLTINRGEILGLVGESGSGKSTLGRSILQLVPTTEGSICYNDNELTSLNAKQLMPFRRKLQMIFQDPYASLNPRMTVYQTLAEPLLYHRLANRKTVDQQVAALMDDVGLARSSLRKYPHEFSGGQRQRIAIGRAIATEPEFIVADEPVSALDVTIQAQILDLILDLVERRNLTLLFISHDLSVIRHICDRVAVMHHGKLVEQADTEQLWTQPQMDYTKTLLQAIPTITSQSSESTTGR